MLTWLAQRLAGPGAPAPAPLHRGDPRRSTASARGCPRRASTRRDQSYFNGQGGTILGLLNLFSGSALSRFSIFALGIMPYVTASIILQLMTVVVPKLEQLQKEGEAGYAKINQYTRYLTVVLAAAQSLGYAFLFHALGRAAQAQRGPHRADRRHAHRRHDAADVDGRADHEARRRQRHLDPDLRVDPHVAPPGINAWLNGGAFEKLFFPIVALGIVVAVVFVQEGQRRIPIQYAKRMVGRRMTSGGSTYMPLRVNMAGVIPVIFAAAVIAFPPTIAQFFPQTQSWINRNFPPHACDVPRCRGVLIIIFTYFYTAVQFNPVDQADNLRKYGGYIPGIRPGPPTAQYLDRVLSRLTLPGSLFLASSRSCRRLHQLRRLLAGDRPRARRHVGADHRRCRPRHDAPDGVADDDALLRGLPEGESRALVLLGPQGSGKGTQAKRIAAAHGVPHISTGDMFRAAIARDGTELGLQVRPILDRRRARPGRADDRADPRAARRSRTRGAGFMLDGFPRTLAQAEALDEMLAELDRPLDACSFFDLRTSVASSGCSGAPRRRAAPTTRPR